MFVYSIIVPSFNQERFIRETLQNLSELKKTAAERNIKIQIILVDNCSDEPTSGLIKEYAPAIDDLLIEKDKGQYDAINKGLRLVKGDYWTWLNTDDLIDPKGFFEIDAYLRVHPKTDYIYGSVAYIDENSKFSKNSSTENLSFNQLLNKDASISQPGSFFRTQFTRTLGNLSPFHFAFDYEYILRCLKNRAVVAKINENVAFFRYYNSSKSGSQDYRFLKEQLKINASYGGSFFSKLSILLRIRILKRKLLN
ncbi:MAG: glycosyltransferase [Bacteroidia bacterium]|nr:glycosyltransferase [Bacteroidia bacterium]